MTGMNWKTRRTAAIAAVAVVALGGGSAIAANTLGDDRDDVIEGAAERLGVSPERLDKALKDSAKAEIDEAVKAGRLTKEQGERMKQGIDQGRGPLLGGRRGPGGPGFGRGHGPGARGLFGDAAAKYLGLTEQQLHEQLRDGKSLADVAKARNKSVDGLKDAIVTAAETRLADEVKDGHLTDAQRDQALKRLKDNIDRIVERTRPAKGPGGRRRGGHGFGPPPGAPGMAPENENGSASAGTAPGVPA